MNVRDLLLAVLLGLALYLAWSSFDQKRILRTMAENLLLRAELERLRFEQGPCFDPSADARTLRVGR